SLSAFLCAAWYLIPAISVAHAQGATPTRPKDEVKNQSAPAESADSSVTQPERNETEGSTREIAIATLNQIIDIVKRTGGADWLAKVQARRDQLANEDETQCAIEVGAAACNMVEQCRQKSELLLARELIPHTLQLAELVKAQSPRVYILAHGEAALVDDDFE